MGFLCSALCRNCEGKSCANIKTDISLEEDEIDVTTELETVYENIETDNDFDESLEESLDISYAIVTDDDDSRPPSPKISKII